MLLAGGQLLGMERPAELAVPVAEDSTVAIAKSPTAEQIKAFCKAAFEGDIDSVRIFVDDFPRHLNATTNRCGALFAAIDGYYSQLNRARIEGCPQVFEMLLEVGADPEIIEHGMTLEGLIEYQVQKRSKGFGPGTLAAEKKTAQWWLDLVKKAKAVKGTAKVTSEEKSQQEDAEKVNNEVADVTTEEKSKQEADARAAIRAARLAALRSAERKEGSLETNKTLTSQQKLRNAQERVDQLEARVADLTLLLSGNHLLGMELSAEAASPGKEASHAIVSEKSPTADRDEQVNRLVQAAFDGNLREVKACINKDRAVIDCKERTKFRNALHAVVEGFFVEGYFFNELTSDHYAVFDYLLSQGADRYVRLAYKSVAQRIRDNVSRWQAARPEVRDQLEQIANKWLTRFMKKNDHLVKKPASRDIVAFIEAAAQGDIYVTKAFLAEFPEDVNATDSYGSSALFTAVEGCFSNISCIKERCREVVELLLAAGADTKHTENGKSIIGFIRQKSTEKATDLYADGAGLQVVTQEWNRIAVNLGHLIQQAEKAKAEKEATKMSPEEKAKQEADARAALRAARLAALRNAEKETNSLVYKGK